MKVNLYSVRDNIAEEFGPIFQAKNHGVAKRNFNKLLENTPEEQKSEYTLLYMGSFDSETGDISLVDTKVEWDRLPTEEVIY